MMAILLFTNLSVRKDQSIASADGSGSAAPASVNSSGVSSVSLLAGCSSTGSAADSTTDVVSLTGAAVVAAAGAGATEGSDCSCTSGATSSSSAASFFSASVSLLLSLCLLSFTACSIWSFSISLANLGLLSFLSSPSFGSGNKAAVGPHRGQQNDTLFFAKRFRSSGVQSSAPIAPSAGGGKKLMSASRMRRIPHAGCQSSG
mmetsp:Transcript_18255/g.33082  ORF Transcript_18255/g.33082 Transcript_18255/m.33082 type:complete len:203 (-) Transcript_18255:277-885(-)